MANVPSNFECYIGWAPIEHKTSSEETINEKELMDEFKTLIRIWKEKGYLIANDVCKNTNISLNKFNNNPYVLICGDKKIWRQHMETLLEKFRVLSRLTNELRNIYNTKEANLIETIQNSIYYQELIYQAFAIEAKTEEGFRLLQLKRKQRRVNV